MQPLRPGWFRPRQLLAGTVAAVLAALTLGASGAAAPAAAAKPTAVVSLGDSYISGEGAGNYEPGTDQPGNFCHRSQVSEIKETTVPADARINLACSGAVTANVALGGTPQNGEAPQAQRLRQVAKDYRIKLVVLSIGGNDVGFAPMILDCIEAYFGIAPRCQDTWAQKFPAGLAAAAPRVAANLADIRTVMRQAGYRDSAYQLVLQSYTSPVTEDNRYSLTKLIEGCPVRDDDAGWARSVVVPSYSATYARIARDSGARFMDLGPAFRGREVCARGIDHSQEWANGIVIDLGEILNGLGQNIVQQSLHPDALGHAQFGRCLSAFYQLRAAAVQCVRGSDGNLGPVPIPAGALTAPPPGTTLPYRYEPKPATARN